MADETTVADSKCLIYAISSAADPDRVRYVGQTRQGMQKRFRGHIHGANAGGESPIYRFIRKVGAENVSVRALETLPSPNELDDREIYWIAHYRSLGMADLNIEAGGRTASGHKYTADQRLELARIRQRDATNRFSDTVLKIRRLSATGLLDVDVASELGVSVQIVTKVMRGETYGYIPWEPGTEIRVNPANRYTDSQKSSIVELYLLGRTWKDIEATLGVGKSSARHHLRAAEETEEFRDAIRAERAIREVKGRPQHKPRRFGTLVPNAKLTDESASAIKKALWLDKPQSEVAEEFQVSRGIVSFISRGLTWRHVPWPIGPRPRPVRWRD